MISQPYIEAPPIRLVMSKPHGFFHLITMTRHLVDNTMYISVIRSHR